MTPNPCHVSGRRRSARSRQPKCPSSTCLQYPQVSASPDRPPQLIHCESTRVHETDCKHPSVLSNFHRLHLSLVISSSRSQYEGHRTTLPHIQARHKLVQSDSGQTITPNSYEVRQTTRPPCGCRVDFAYTTVARFQQYTHGPMSYLGVT